MDISWTDFMSRFRRVDPIVDVHDVEKAEANLALEALSVVDSVEVSWNVAERLGLDLNTHSDDDHDDHEGHP